MYDEAVGDEVVLDLRYEARDIDQDITSEAKIDQWFDLKTQGLSDLARAQLRQKWATMRKVTSSLDRIRKIVADILMDMETRDRLRSGRGNAMLVSGSVYAACRFFDAFRETELKDRCAICYLLQSCGTDIKGEETGEGLTEKLLKYAIYRKMLADYFGEPADRAMRKAEQFEQEVKRRFVNEPGQMKLLIVVDKLLTGFDALTRDVSLHRQEDAGSRSLPGDLPRQPPGRRGQGVRLHRRLQGSVPVVGGGRQGIHGRGVRGL